MQGADVRVLENPELLPTAPYRETIVSDSDGWVAAVEPRAIVCADDRALNPDWLRTAARERLGIDVAEIAGGHSPFLTRPSELAALIDSLVV